MLNSLLLRTIEELKEDTREKRVRPPVDRPDHLTEANPRPDSACTDQAHLQENDALSEGTPADKPDEGPFRMHQVPWIAIR